MRTILRLPKALIEELETINKIKFHNGNFYRWGGSHEVYPAVEIEREIHLRYGSCGANKDVVTPKVFYKPLAVPPSLPL